MTREDLISEFNRESYNIIETIKSEVYTPSRYINMIKEHGHYGAAKIIAISTKTYGLEKLWVNHRHLLIENLIVDPKYKDLFTEKEIRFCLKKLKPS